MRTTIEELIMRKKQLQEEVLHLENLYKAALSSGSDQASYEAWKRLEEALQDLYKITAALKRVA